MLSVNQIVEFIANLDGEESKDLLFALINALINDDVNALEQLKVRIEQMIRDDEDPNIIRLY